MSVVQPILLAAAIYNLILVVIILRTRGTDRTGISFAWYILATVGWTICIALMSPRYESITLWLVRATFFCGTLIGISWVWFCEGFPRPSFRQTASCIATLTGLPWLIIAWTDWLIPQATLAHGWVKAEMNIIWVLVFFLWIAACTIAGMVLLIVKVKQVRGLERLQVRYILLGAGGLMLAGSFIDLVLPVMTGSTRYSLYGPLASLFITTTTTYAIVRYRLMDIKIVLRAGLVYSVTIGVLSLIFALMVPILDRLLSLSLRFPEGTSTFIMAFLIVLAFQPLQRYVQNVVDRRFFKSVYDYRVTLREAGSALASARNREVLVETLVNALNRTLRPRGVCVYLPGIGELLTQATPPGSLHALPFTMPEPEPVLAYALETDEVMLTDELTRTSLLPQHTIGTRLKHWGASVALPLIAGDRLCGIVFLDEKLSGDVYTADDIGLLRILGKQTAIALDNARHYDEVVLLNEYHERLLQIMQDGVIAVDPAQHVMTFNKAAETITGIPVERAVGSSLIELGLNQLPIQDTGGMAVETRLTIRDDQAIPILVTVTPFLRRWDVAESHLIVFRDLSALRALEQEKMQAERFSSMGAMAASLAHEIKNPLVPIQTFAHLLPSKYDDDEFRREFSRTVVMEVERINRLVGQMLDLVRKPSYDRGEVDLREVLGRLLTVIRPECERHGIRINTHLAEDLPVVVGVAGQLYQAILNILVNAVQVMHDGGELTIRLHRVDDDIVCSIADTGPGVPPEALSRIFEPLYTTKAGGHGLGLALTYQFVRSHGGDVHAESMPGHGLTITFTLPTWQHRDAELLCS
jgi:signal transduction histidine kinase